MYRFGAPLPVALVCAAVLANVACERSAVSGATALDKRTVTLPDGSAVQAEVKITPEEMAKGMMYRDSIPDGTGMLFVHEKTSLNAYWMGHCVIPLDIIWMDAMHHVVEISAGTPPCPSGGSECPSYGGHAQSQFVLELGSGEAARHRVREGSALQF